MIKVAGNWEWGWITPKEEVWQWNLLIRDFKITEWYMWPIVDVINTEQKINLHQRKTIEEILEENKDLHHVYVEPERMIHPNKGINLKEFNHPKDALYIFGSANYSSIFGNKKDGDSMLFIETLNNAGVLWPHQCLAIILYDRLLKGWEGK